MQAFVYKFVLLVVFIVFIQSLQQKSFSITPIRSKTNRFSSFPFHTLRNGITVKKSIQLSMQTVTLPTYSVYPNADYVGQELCQYIFNTARKEISTKGSFHIAVPGGSAIKLLKYLKPYKELVDWSKVTMFYVNHKCVLDTDENATHFKAKSIFLDHIQGIKVFVPDASKSYASDRAAAYEKVLKENIPTKNGLPYFDLVVLGMGKDGHIGSLYPGRSEVNEKTSLVVPVDKKDPPSVTLTLPVLNNAKEIRVIVTGEDKAEAINVAMKKLKSTSDFPVCGIRSDNIAWIIDKPGAALL